MKHCTTRKYLNMPVESVPKMPSGLIELMEGLSKEVLRHNPTNVLEFCADHMRKLLQLRDVYSPKKSLTLEEKIEKASNIMQKRAEKRRQKYDKDMLIFNRSEDCVRLATVENIAKTECDIKNDVEEAQLCNVVKEQILNDDRESKIEENQSIPTASKEIEIVTAKRNELLDDEPMIPEDSANLTSVIGNENSNVNNELNTESILNNSDAPACDIDVVDATENSIEMQSSNILTTNIINSSDGDSEDLFNQQDVPVESNNSHEIDMLEKTLNGDKFEVLEKDDQLEENDLNGSVVAAESEDTQNLGSPKDENNIINLELCNEDENIERIIEGQTDACDNHHVNDTSATPIDIADSQVSFDPDVTVIESQTKLEEQNVAKYFLKTETSIALEGQDEAENESNNNFQQVPVALIEENEVINQNTGESILVQDGVTIVEDNILENANGCSKYLEQTTVIETEKIMKAEEKDSNDVEHDGSLIELINENNGKKLSEEVDANEIKKEILVNYENKSPELLEQEANELGIVVDNSKEIKDELDSSKSIDPSELKCNESELIQNDDFDKKLDDKKTTYTLNNDLKNMKRGKDNEEKCTEDIQSKHEDSNKSTVKICDDTNNVATNDVLEEQVDLVHQSSFQSQAAETHNHDIPDATNGDTEDDKPLILNIEIESENSDDNKTINFNDAQEISTIESKISKTMDLETAAITIQKVFRNFLFRSKTSSFEDPTNIEFNIFDHNTAPQGEMSFANKNQIMNKDKRAIGISRMDTVLQTVNEEKSLSLSTDDSSTLSSAATVIQAHIRGFLVRNRLNRNKTTSTTSEDPMAASFETDPDPARNKTVLNIHIVPEGRHFLSRDESMLTSVELSLDGSPPTSTNLHPLGYDRSERRKQLKREDAIQSVSPPSNSSTRLSEEVDSLKEIAITEQDNEKDTLDSNADLTFGSKSNQNDESNVVMDKAQDKLPENHEGLLKDTTIEVQSEKADIISISDEAKQVENPNLKSLSDVKPTDASDELDVVTPFENVEEKGDGDGVNVKLEHSGEFHDVVLPTKVSRNDTSVVSDFQNVLAYFLVWNNS